MCRKYLLYIETVVIFLDLLLAQKKACRVFIWSSTLHNKPPIAPFPPGAFECEGEFHYRKFFTDLFGNACYTLSILVTLDRCEKCLDGLPAIASVIPDDAIEPCFGSKVGQKRKKGDLVCTQKFQ